MKLTQTQQVIADAFAAYKNGSTGVVRAFEQAIHGFWHQDSCNPTNLQFFLNVAKRFPVLQKVAIQLLSKKGPEALAYLEIKKDKKSGDFVITNSKDITKEMKVVARQNVQKFIANQYTSLMHEKSIKVEITFDATKGAATIQNAIFAQVKAMIAVHGEMDPAIITKMVNDATAKALNQDSILKATVEARKLKEKAAKVETQGKMGEKAAA